MVKYFIAILLTCSLALPVNATSTKVYVWRNDKGVLVFSDSPKSGAEEVTLKPGNNVLPPMNVDTSILDITPKVLKNDYEVLIIQPKDVIKEEIQSKISETLLLFELIKNNYDIKEHLNKNLIFLVCLCKVINSHSVLFDKILRSLQNKFKHNIEIDMFIYTELETYIIDRV
jgi:hypothetical protein